MDTQTALIWKASYIPRWFTHI